MGNKSLIQDKYDIIYRQSNDRRRQFQQFTNALIKRVEIQENYSKSLQYVAKSIEKFIRDKSVISFIYSAFKSNNQYRSDQVRAFANSLREQVIAMLKNTLNNQSNQCKKLQKDAKKLEKDLQVLSQNLSKTKLKFIQFDKQRQQQELLNQILRSNSEVNFQKKQKQNQKTKQLQKQTKQYELLYKNALKQYNQFISTYYNEMEKILTRYQQHQTTRIQKQVETIMKILIFQTSMMKNFDYDIINISSQMQKIKAESQIQAFIQQNTSNKQKLAFQPLYNNENLLNLTVQKVVKKQFDHKISFEQNKQIKQLIEKKYKQQQSFSFKFIKQVQLVQFNSIFDIINRVWDNLEINQGHLQNLKILIDKDINRHLFYQISKYCGSMVNLQIPRQTYQIYAKMYQIVLEKCLQKKDIFIARKLMNLMFIHWTQDKKMIKSKQETKRPISENIQNQKKIDQKLLFLKLYNFSFWKSNDFWQAAIFQSIHQSLKTSVTNKGQTLSQTIAKQKNIILSQLASFCHSMILFGMTSKNVKLIVGKYCRLYYLEDDQNKDLSKAINYASKQFKQLVNKGYIEKQQKKQVKQLSEKEESTRTKDEIEV